MTKEELLTSIITIKNHEDISKRRLQVVYTVDEFTFARLYEELAGSAPKSGEGLLEIDPEGGFMVILKKYDGK